MKEMKQRIPRFLLALALLLALWPTAVMAAGGNASVELGQPTGLQVSPAGNCILKLTWKAGSMSGVTADQVQYLIYRADSADGTFEKIGYTLKGATAYLDGGGDGMLTAGKTYYYKVQAYDDGSKVGSQLSAAVGEVAAAAKKAANEFTRDDEAAMVAYLRQSLLDRAERIEINLWAKEWNASEQYHKKLYEQAVAEEESLQADSGAGDYLVLHIRNYGTEFEDLRVKQNSLQKYKLVYLPVYYDNAAEDEAVEHEIGRLVNGGLGLKKNATDVEKAKAVYEYLAANTLYDHASLSQGLRPCAAYDALIEHKAVCQGYANAAYRLLRELGVMNRIVIGDVKYDGEWRVHAWNYVCLDGEWYHFDATTESHFYEEYRYFSYRWLLKSNDDMPPEQFRKDPDMFNETFEAQHPAAKQSVQIPLEAPALTAEAISSVTIKLTWQKIDRATGYELYRAESEDGSYTPIADIAGRETADKDITQGKTYYYKVRAYDGSGKERLYSDFSPVARAMTLETPVLSSTSFTYTPQGIGIAWSRTKGATAYTVYRATSSGGEYTAIATKITAPSYVDGGVKAGQTYSYKVRAYNPINQGQYSSYSNEKSATAPQQMTAPAAAPKSGVTMRLSWNALSGYTGYELYRADSENGTYTYVKSTTGTSTSDTNLTAGTRYYYKLAAYKTVNGQKVYTLLSAPVAAVTLATPAISKAEPTDTGVQVRWSKASGADRYNVYRADTQNGKYTYLASVVGGTQKYVDTTAQGGHTYYYKVRPYKKYDGIVYYGGYSEAQAVTVLADTKLTAAPKSGVTMRLNWTAVSGATSYELYRATDAKGPYTYVKSTTGTSTSDTNLTAGTRYYYMIRAVKTVNGAKQYSKYAAAVAVALATPIPETAKASGSGVTLTWSKASGADRYNVYRYDGGDYVYVASIVGGVQTYTDAGGKAGDQYKIRAYKRVDGVVYYGGWSDAIQAK